MATLSTAKPKERPRLALSRRQIIEPSPPPELFDKVPEQTPLERLIEKNPNLAMLISTLDLVEVASSQPLPEIADNPPVVSSAEPNSDKLQVIAQKALPMGDSYTREEAIERIQAATNVSAQRAANGLELMIEREIVNVTPLGQHYLFDTTPF